MNKQIIAVMSGKGGVGKSTVTSLISLISSETKKTLVLDFDLAGPSLNQIFSTDQKIIKQKKGLKAAKIKDNLYMLSMSLLIKPTESVIWRGPKKIQLLQMFFDSIDDYDLIVIDLPPGVSEEQMFLINKNVSAVLVTTPQNLALSDVTLAIEFCVKNDIKIEGLVENMSGYVCKCCNKEINIFGKKGGELLAEDYNINFLGAIKLNNEISKLIENGTLASDYKNIDEYQKIKKMTESILK
ncbi:Nucleotide-binding protein 2 [Binucleata daphniae]